MNSRAVLLRGKDVIIAPPATFIVEVTKLLTPSGKYVYHVL